MAFRVNAAWKSCFLIHSEIPDMVCFSVQRPSISVSRARVQGILETVTQEIKGDHRHKNEQSGPSRKFGRGPDQVLRIAQHIAPTGDRKLDAEPEEAEDGLKKNDIADGQRRSDDNRRNHIWQNMQQQYTVGSRAERDGGTHEITAFHGQGFGADQPGDRRPADHRDYDDDTVETGVF